MRIIADLHIHSKYSAATSEEMNLVNLGRQAVIKGLNILGTGDNSSCKI
jgi:PHP family Zn ribbon phosphoesterase